MSEVYFQPFQFWMKSVYTSINESLNNEESPSTISQSSKQRVVWDLEAIPANLRKQTMSVINNSKMFSRRWISGLVVLLMRWFMNIFIDIYHKIWP